MKRAILLIVVVALAFACCLAGCSRAGELASTAAEKVSSKVEQAKELLSDFADADDRMAASEGADDRDDQAAASEDPDGPSSSSPSSDGADRPAGLLSSAADVVLVPTDDYAAGYVFEYGGEQFTAYFDSYSWRVYDSYKITNHDDIVAICQALINEHPVYGSDWESLRTADDMAFEWEQHNLAYEMLPEDSHWRDDAKDVDLDPEDQGMTFLEMYERRTG